MENATKMRCFGGKKYRTKTTNAHDKRIYRKEYEDYMKGWSDNDE